MATYINIGNPLPRPLAFLSHRSPPLMWTIGDDVNTFVLISTIGDIYVDVFNQTRQQHHHLGTWSEKQLNSLE